MNRERPRTFQVPSCHHLDLTETPRPSSQSRGQGSFRKVSSHRDHILTKCVGSVLAVCARGQMVAARMELNTYVMADQCSVVVFVMAIADETI